MCIHACVCACTPIYMCVHTCKHTCESPCGNTSHKVGGGIYPGLLLTQKELLNVEPHWRKQAEGLRVGKHVSENPKAQDNSHGSCEENTHGNPSRTHCPPIRMTGIKHRVGSIKCWPGGGETGPLLQPGWEVKCHGCAETILAGSSEVRHLHLSCMEPHFSSHGQEKPSASEAVCSFRQGFQWVTSYTHRHTCVQNGADLLL